VCRAIFFTAWLIVGWWQSLKGFYESLNGELEVVIVSGDRDANGFKKTMDGFPWVAVPFGEKRPAIEAAVPCTG
jgi:hypothetical protein